MLLKSSKVNMQSHPVIKRLYQYRQLLEKMDEVFIDVIKPQISILLQAKVYKTYICEPIKTIYIFLIIHFRMSRRLQKRKKR